MTTPGAALRAMRPDRTVICDWCWTAFRASDTKAAYCSNRCRQAAKYARKKAEKKL